MKKLLIRADDLGCCKGVNLGIAKCVNEGAIRGVGVMPNMPLTKSGLSLLKRNDLCLGQHTNICDGPSVSQPSRIPSLVGADGQFKPAKVYRTAAQDFVVYDEAARSGNGELCDPKTRGWLNAQPDLLLVTYKEL